MDQATSDGRDGSLSLGPSCVSVRLIRKAVQRFLSWLMTPCPHTTRHVQDRVNHVLPTTCCPVWKEPSQLTEETAKLVDKCGTLHAEALPELYTVAVHATALAPDAYPPRSGPLRPSHCGQSRILWCTSHCWCRPLQPRPAWFRGCNLIWLPAAASRARAGRHLAQRSSHYTARVMTTMMMMMMIYIL